MKKYLKVLCTAITIFTITSSSMPTLALTSSNSKTNTDTVKPYNDVIYLSKDNYGHYITTDKKLSKLTAKMTKDYGVYLTDTNDLISSTGVDTYMSVNKYEATLADTNAINELLKNNLIRDEVKNDILKQSAEAIKNNNFGAKVSLILPKSSSSNIGIISPQAVYDNYYTYNGKKMMDEQIFYYGISTGYQYVVTGTTTSRIADTIWNIALVGAGFVNPPLAIVAGGISLLSYFENATSTYTISGSTSDFLQVAYVYDVSTKWTYADMGSGYQLGAITQHVYLQTYDTYQQYMVNSSARQVTSHKVLNSTQDSPNYYSPAAKAINNILNPWDERMHTKIGDKMFYY